jgi:hypothetical protein
VPKNPEFGGNNTARNVLITYDVTTCRAGPDEPGSPEVLYQFKPRFSTDDTNYRYSHMPQGGQFYRRSYAEEPIDYLDEFSQPILCVKLMSRSEGPSRAQSPSAQSFNVETMADGLDIPRPMNF